MKKTFKFIKFLSCVLICASCNSVNASHVTNNEQMSKCCLEKCITFWKKERTILYGFIAVQGHI